MHRRDLLRVWSAGFGFVTLKSGALSPQSAALPFRLADVTASAGLQFRHNNGAYGGKLLPETLGAGCAFIDYDNDGWQDLFVLNCNDRPRQLHKLSTLRL